MSSLRRFDDVVGLGGVELQLLIDFVPCVFSAHAAVSAIFPVCALFWCCSYSCGKPGVIASVVIVVCIYGLIEVPRPQNLPFLALSKSP